MIKQTINIVRELGITQWRLRTPVAEVLLNQAAAGLDQAAHRDQEPRLEQAARPDKEPRLSPEPQAETQPDTQTESTPRTASNTASLDKSAPNDLASRLAKMNRNSEAAATPLSQYTPEPIAASEQPLNEQPLSELGASVAQSPNDQTSMVSAKPLKTALEQTVTSALNGGEAQRAQTPPLDTPIAVSWETLESAFEQRIHCGQNSGLRALPSAEQRQARCAVILPAPSLYDLDKQQVHSESSQRLLSEILRALGVPLMDTYQTNSIKCAGAALNEEPCVEWVQSELKLLAPKLCLVFGEAAARAVLKTNNRLAELRSEPQNHPFLPMQCLITHSLEDMLSNPALKQDCWRDLRAANVVLADD